MLYTNREERLLAHRAACGCPMAVASHLVSVPFSLKPV